MRYTSILGLRKPDGSDIPVNTDFNYNAEILDEKVGESNRKVVQLLNELNNYLPYVDFYAHANVSASVGLRGHVKLNNTVTSISTVEALTAHQGKILNDRIQKLEERIYLLENKK